MEASIKERTTYDNGLIYRDELASSPTTASRRSIFQTFWKKTASSGSMRDDDNGSNSSEVSQGRESRQRSPQSTKLEPSYLGIYSFAPPSPTITSKFRPNIGTLPPLSPLSSTDSLLTPSPTTKPKSILRRHHSHHERRILSVESRPEIMSCGNRTRSENACFAMDRMDEQHQSVSELPFAPILYKEEASEDELASISSRDSRQHSCVHFDPTITFREVVSHTNSESNWFNDTELGTFMAEAVNLCHSSAINAIKTYSLPAVAKAHAKACEKGIKDPILSTSSPPESRALFSDPILHATDEDAIIHDGSKRFFKLLSKEVRRALIVDNSRTTLKLLQRHVLTMFPHVQVDMALSVEDALKLVRVELDDSTLDHRHSLGYDIVIAEEHLQQGPTEECNSDHTIEKTNDGMHASNFLTGSELLRHINDVESRCINCQLASDTNHEGMPRKSLKIGTSVNLSEDCESLRRGGADLMWPKPSPVPSSCLRNQLLNTLLAKRGKSVFVCGCYR